MEIKLFILFYHVFGFVQEVYSEELCPHKVVEDDPYNVKKTFDAVRSAAGNTLSVHHKHTTKDRENEDYIYTINLCNTKDQPAVVQKDTNNKDDKTNRKLLGKVDQSSILLGGENWLFVQYFHGDKYTTKNHCSGKQRQSWLSIRCEDKGEKPNLKVIEEARYLTGKDHPDTPCYYLFEYNHPAACTEKSQGLSGGAIFLIILFSVAAAYLIFGFLYQRFIKGAKGFDQIPNYPFWRKVGNSAADGCDFVCRREERSTTYKGMADALDIDTDDDDKDDGLLPM